MNTYFSWKVDTLYKSINGSPDDIVLTANVICSAACSDARKSRTIGVEFDYDPSQAEFIPWDNLTEQIILDWTFAKLGIGTITIQDELSTQLDQILNTQRIVQDSPPWVGIST